MFEGTILRTVLYQRNFWVLSGLFKILNQFRSRAGFMLVFSGSGLSLPAHLQLCKIVRRDRRHREAEFDFVVELRLIRGPLLYRLTLV